MSNASGDWSSGTGSETVLTPLLLLLFLFEGRELAPERLLLLFEGKELAPGRLLLLLFEGKELALPIGYQ
jgi:hypothetical protein